MKFERVLPALRKGKKVRRAIWDVGEYIEMDVDVLIDEDGKTYTLIYRNLFETDWEIILEPRLVADYLVECPNENTVWFKEKHEVGKQPESAIIIPGSERNEV